MGKQKQQKRELPLILKHSNGLESVAWFIMTRHTVGWRMLFPLFSPEWWEMLRFSAKEAERLGLTFEVNVSNGFVAGGPWITYEYGMKYLAATERKLHGGQYFEGKLEVPVNRYNYSRDVAVIAFPVPAGGGISSATEKVSYSSNMSGNNLGKIFLLNNHPC